APWQPEQCSRNRVQPWRGSPEGVGLLRVRVACLGASEGRAGSVLGGQAKRTIARAESARGSVRTSPALAPRHAAGLTSAGALAYEPLVGRDSTKSLTSVPGVSLESGRYFVVIGPSSSSMFALPESGELLIGRAPECELRIDDDSVSRKHAKLAIDSEDVVI